MIESCTLSLMSVCLDRRKMTLFQNYLLEYLQIQCGIRLFTSSYLCITLVKIRNAALQKKESLTSKYFKIPNVIYCEGMI
jgi:hypothetical protein